MFQKRKKNNTIKYFLNEVKRRYWPYTMYSSSITMIVTTELWILQTADKLQKLNKSDSGNSKYV